MIGGWHWSGKRRAGSEHQARGRDLDSPLHTAWQDGFCWGTIAGAMAGILLTIAALANFS